MKRISPMTKNMGTADRALRLAVAAVLAYLALGTTMLGAGLLFWGALAVAAVFVLTSVVSICPLYPLIGLKTCKEC